MLYMLYVLECYMLVLYVTECYMFLFNFVRKMGPYETWSDKQVLSVWRKGDLVMVRLEEWGERTWLITLTRDH